MTTSKSTEKPEETPAPETEEKAPETPNADSTSGAQTEHEDKSKNRDAFGNDYDALSAEHFQNVEAVQVFGPDNPAPGLEYVTLPAEDKE